MIVAGKEGAWRKAGLDIPDEAAVDN